MDVALGLKARTGRAVLVAVGGSPRDPLFVERCVLPLLPEGAFAPYHAAEGLEPVAAHESVRLSISAANRLAAAGMREAANRLAAAGHTVRGRGVLVGPGAAAELLGALAARLAAFGKSAGPLWGEDQKEAAAAALVALHAHPDRTH